MKKFKVGDRVISIGDNISKDEIGTIIYIRNYDYSVEFDNNINGHGCSNNPIEYRGKKGYCWNCDEQDLKLSEEPKLNVEPNYEIY